MFLKIISFIAVIVQGLNLNGPKLVKWNSDADASQGWNPSMSSDINRLLKTLELGNSAPGISRNLNKFANMKFRRSFSYE